MDVHGQLAVLQLLMGEVVTDCMHDQCMHVATYVLPCMHNYIHT